MEYGRWKENVPVPNLPGLRSATPRLPARARGHALRYEHGIMGVYDGAVTPRPQTARPASAAPAVKQWDAVPPWAEPGGANTGWTKQTADPIAHSGGVTARAVPSRPMSARPATATAVATPEVSPAWLAYDRQVLRFYAWFEERGAAENLDDLVRFRRCTIYFYLEDGTMHVGEKREANSGLQQGVLVKRHRVPRPGGAGFVGVGDLNVGARVEFYRRVYNIVSCDEFTRDFLTREGVDVPQDGEFPVDRYHERLAQQERREAKGAKGNPTAFAKARKFYDYDRQVLRFFCTWDNRNEMYGDRRAYVLHYFLADDTVEVLEVIERNSGRDPFPKLLNRGPLPKQVYSLGAPPMSEDTRRRVRHEFYNWTELRVGGVILVYGRPLQIHDCDEFTRSFYIQELGLSDQDFVPLPVEDHAPPPPERKIPPHVGLAVGSEEDSAENCKRLIPKARQRDWHQWNDAKGEQLIFKAVFAEDEVYKFRTSVDADREFVLKYFLEDDTVSIFEPPIRNSGVVGGPFLHRGVLRKPGSKLTYKARDLYCGARLIVNNRLFELTAADEATLKHMEAHPQTFPRSDFAGVAGRVAHETRADGGAALKDALIRRDRLGQGLLTVEEVKAALMETCSVVAHEALTVARRLFSPQQGGVEAQTLLRTLGLLDM